MSVPLLVAGCEISIWRTRLGEGESSESVAAGPGGEGDNVPCEFVPMLGGSGGGAITHVIYYLRERDYAPSLIPLSPSSRFSHQTAPDAGLPSADEQFLARVRQIYSTLTRRIQMALLVRIILSLVRCFLPSGVILPMRSRGAFDFLKIHLVPLSKDTVLLMPDVDNITPKSLLIWRHSRLGDSVRDGNSEVKQNSLDRMRGARGGTGDATKGVPLALNVLESACVRIRGQRVVKGKRGEEEQPEKNGEE
ncbi:hypothetical protein EDB85DRAFT_2280043 [Lactarius pseudohatsudake]|nr:hypothetical protein EDB85DRAFT_2280043 [Lactarius pseudohatsudake]